MTDRLKTLKTSKILLGVTIDKLKEATDLVGTTSDVLNLIEDDDNVDFITNVLDNLIDDELRKIVGTLRDYQSHIQEWMSKETIEDIGEKE